MPTHINKKPQSKAHGAANLVANNKHQNGVSQEFTDQRPEAEFQKNLVALSSGQPIQMVQKGALVTDGENYFDADGTETKGAPVPNDYRPILTELGKQICDYVQPIIINRATATNKIDSLLNDIGTLIEAKFLVLFTDAIRQQVKVDTNTALKALQASLIPGMQEAISTTYDHSKPADSFFAADGLSVADQPGANKYITNKIFKLHSSLSNQLVNAWKEGHPDTIGVTKRVPEKTPASLPVTGYEVVETKGSQSDLEKSNFNGYAKVGSITSDRDALKKGLQEKKLDTQIKEYDMPDSTKAFLLYRSDTRGNEIFNSGFKPKDETLGGPIFRSSKMDIDPHSAVCASFDPAACAIFPIHTDEPKVDFIAKTNVWVFVASKVFPTLLVQAAHFEGRQESAKFNLYAEEVALHSVSGENILGYIEVTRRAKGASYPLGYEYTSKKIHPNSKFADPQFRDQQLAQALNQIGEASPSDPQLKDDNNITKNPNVLRYEIIKDREKGKDTKQKIEAYKKLVSPEKVLELEQIAPIKAPQPVHKQEDKNAAASTVGNGGTSSEGSDDDMMGGMFGK